jgi:hypothetical protein
MRVGGVIAALATPQINFFLKLKEGKKYPQMGSEPLGFILPLSISGKN